MGQRLHGNFSKLACRTQISMNRSPALCTLLLPVPLLLLSEWKLDYRLSEICQYYVLYFDAFCSSISTQWMTSSANVVLLQLTSVYLSDYSRKFRRKGLSVKGLYRVWANFGPQKSLSNFWENVGIILKYRMFNTSWNMTLFKICTWFRYMT